MGYETVKDIKAERDALMRVCKKIMKRVDQASEGLPSGSILDKEGASVPIAVTLLRELRNIVGGGKRR